MDAARNMNLVAAFKRYGLDLKILPSSPNASNAHIFFMNIGRQIKGTRRKEWFEIWPGHEDNNVQVLSGNASKAQVVLLVNEPQRSFEDTISRGIVSAHLKKDGESALAVMLRANRLIQADVVKWEPKRKQLIVRRTTTAGSLHYLAGRDERQLFIAKLPRPCTTWDQAQKILKPDRVRFAEGSRRVKRQGEWFFMETTSAERDACEQAVREGKLIKGASIGTVVSGAYARSGLRRPGEFGNPHTVTEAVVIRGERLRHGFSVRPREVYIRGKVQHVDHRTTSFKQWRKVIRNTETDIGAAARTGWID